MTYIASEPTWEAVKFQKFPGGGGGGSPHTPSLTTPLTKSVVFSAASELSFYSRTSLQSEMFRHSLTRFLGFPKAFRRPGISSPNFVCHRKNAPELVTVLRRAQSGGTERFEVPLSDHKYYRYHDVQKDRDLVMKRLLEDSKRFQKIAEREDRSDTGAEAFRASFDGKYFTFHRGIDLMKGCHDLVIYMQLFWHVKPATIIEIAWCCFWWDSNLDGRHAEVDGH